MKLTISHDSYMRKALADRRRATEYLNAAVADGELKYLLIAIRRVVGANGGMGALAKAVGMSRTTLYKTLSLTGNPGFETLKTIVAVYGIRLGFFPVVDPPGTRPAARRQHHGGHYQHL